MPNVEIMCTLTAKQILEQDALVKEMYEAGMRSVRINTAHLEGVESLEKLTMKLKSSYPAIRILIDTKGPEMRTTAVAGDGEIRLEEGMEVRIAGDANDMATTPQIIYVNYPLIHTELKPGNVILVDDGKIVMRVTDVADNIVKAVVETGGLLGSRKGLAVQGVDVNLPPVSAHDRMYISYAAKSDYVDVIAHSFVRSRHDVIAVKEAMGLSTKPVIAKIENQQGIDNLDDIIKESDGILIARGDLTASIGKESVPAAQAKIATATKAAGLPLYLATNILTSLMVSVEVSAKDVSGIKLAASQGVDVMLLTNETASGPRPSESVKALSSILELAFKH